MFQGHFVGYNPYIGCAAVRLWHNSRIEVVVIDDKIPCFKDPDTATYIPVFTYTVHGESWCALLEKAWAKLRGGSYSNFGNIRMSDMLVDLTGEYVVDAELEGDVVSSDYFATSAHAAHTVNSVATPPGNRQKFVAANERHVLLGDRKTMYDDLFNILLSRSTTGNTLMCAEPVSSIYNNEYNCDHRGNKISNYSRNINADLGDVEVGLAGDLLSSDVGVGMFESSRVSGRPHSLAPSSPRAALVYPCVVLGVMQKARPPRPLTVSFEDTAKAVPVERSRTGGKAVVYNETPNKRSESFRQVATVAEDVSDLRFVRIGTIASREALVARQRAGAVKGADWSQWADNTSAEEMNATIKGLSCNANSIPGTPARSRSAVTPVPPTALAKTMSNHNKLTHISKPNEVTDANLYRKLTGVLENTGGMVDTLPVPPDETLSEWIPWKEFLRRYRVLSVCCLLSMQATKPTSMSIADPGNLFHSYEAVQGLWHNSNYEQFVASGDNSVNPVVEMLGQSFPGELNNNMRVAPVIGVGASASLGTQDYSADRSSSNANVSASAVGSTVKSNRSAAVRSDSAPVTQTQSPCPFQSHSDSRLTSSVVDEFESSFGLAPAPTPAPVVAPLPMVTCGGSYHSCSFRQNQMYHLSLPKGTVSRQACRLYVSLHTPDALLPSADSLRFSSKMQQMNYHVNSPNFDTADTCNHNQNDDGHSGSINANGGTCVVAPEYPVCHAGGINSPELFTSRVGSICYSSVESDRRERDVTYGSSGALRSHQVHTYVPIALSIYKYEPLMKTLLVQTVYRNCKNICVEMDVNADNTELLVVPSTYHPNILHGRFWLTASLVTLSTGVITSLPLRLHTDWPLYPFSTPMLRNQWSLSGGTAHGRIGLCTPFSFKNPCYRVKCYMNVGSGSLKESVRIIVILSHHKTTTMKDVSKLTTDFVSPSIPMSSSYKGVVGTPNHYQLKHIMTLHNSPSKRSTGRPPLTPYDALSVISCVNNSKSDGSLTGQFNTNTNAAAEDNVLFHRVGCYILTHDAYSELCVNKGVLKRYEDGVIGSMAFNVGRECVRSETITPAMTYSVSCPYDPDVVDLVVLPCTWFPQHEGEFMLQVLCDCPCEIFEV